MSAERRREQTQFSGTIGDMAVALEELHASMGPDLYAEPLRAIALAVKIARARQHATVPVVLPEAHAAPLLDFLLWRAGWLTERGEPARADALRRIAHSHQILA